MDEACSPEPPCERPSRRFPWSLEDIISSNEIWLCASCFTCVDRCPRDVGFTRISLALRNLAAREGNIPEALRDMGGAILDGGLAYRIPASRLKERGKRGLPELPSVGAERVRALLEGAGFHELLARKRGT